MNKSKTQDLKKLSSLISGGIGNTIFEFVKENPKTPVHKIIDRVNSANKRYVAQPEISSYLRKFRLCGGMDFEKRGCERLYSLSQFCLDVAKLIEK